VIGCLFTIAPGNQASNLNERVVGYSRLPPGKYFLLSVPRRLFTALNAIAI
jgi:hypothetical protein